MMGKRGEGKGWRPRGGGLRWVRGEREFHMLAILGEKVVHAALIWRVTRSAHLRRPPPLSPGRRCWCRIRSRYLDPCPGFVPKGFMRVPGRVRVRLRSVGQKDQWTDYV